MRKLAIVLIGTVMTVGGAATPAVAAAGHPAPQMRDTNWPCATC
jgi:hypothetical protein